MTIFTCDLQDFSFSLPKKSSFLLYSSYHCVSEESIYFDECYDYEWYIKNRYKYKFRRSKLISSGIDGYIEVDGDIVSYSVYYENQKPKLFVSNVCTRDSWSDFDEVLKDIYVFSPKRNLESSELNRYFSELLNLEVNLQKQEMVRMADIIESSEVEILKKSGVYFFGPLRVSPLVLYSQNRPVTFAIYDKDLNYNSTSALKDGVAYIRGTDIPEDYVERIRVALGKVRINKPNSDIRSSRSIHELIEADPRVYYKGIARHCPVRPTPVVNPQNQQNTDTQILYPKTNPRLYIAPPGYYISLKINKVKPPPGLKPFPAFPCCIASQERRGNNVYKIYRECTTDEEFAEKIKDITLRTSTTRLIEPEYTGSLYMPLNKFWNPNNFYRKRVLDWSSVFSVSGKLVVDSQVELNSRKLGLRDTSGLQKYIDNDPAHDIRLTYHLINKDMVILVKRPNDLLKQYSGKKLSQVDPKVTPVVIIYEDKELQGSEVILSF
ncbi:hypothetical protein BX667DRAFT_224519 [Coemansia mojavensis]|nr:hypothetical protein BX667DRAFT_224519 [Coemansia mojavensis]